MIPEPLVVRFKNSERTSLDIQREANILSVFRKEGQSNVDQTSPLPRELQMIKQVDQTVRSKPNSANQSNFTI